MRIGMIKVLAISLAATACGGTSSLSSSQAASIILAGLTENACKTNGGIVGMAGDTRQFATIEYEGNFRGQFSPSAGEEDSQYRLVKTFEKWAEENIFAQDQRYRLVQKAARRCPDYSRPAPEKTECSVETRLQHFEGRTVDLDIAQTNLVMGQIGGWKRIAMVEMRYCAEMPERVRVLDITVDESGKQATVVYNAVWKITDLGTKMMSMGHYRPNTGGEQRALLERLDATGWRLVRF